MTTTPEQLPFDSPSNPAEPTAPEDRERRRKLLLLLLIGAAVLIVLLAILYKVFGEGGTGIPGISGPAQMPTYSFSMYGVTRPLGVAVSTSGDRIYVTESDGPRVVHVYDRDGKQVGTLEPSKSKALAHVPVYVAVDPLTDDVYVSDRVAAKIYVYRADGTYKGVFRPNLSNLGGAWQPLGLAFDANGVLYVTDASAPANRVLSFTRGGKLLHRFGTSLQYAFPNGIAVDRDGNVYVADSNNGRVVVLDKSGGFVTAISSGSAAQRLGLPRGLAIEGDRLYVVDTTDQSVQVFQIQDGGSAPPKNIGSFGEEGSLEGGFEYPNGVAVDTQGRVYVTDRENGRVQVWSR